MVKRIREKILKGERMCDKCGRPIVEKQKVKMLLPSNQELHSKIRRTWNISPVEKIKKSKKIYYRPLSKREVRDVLTKEDF